MRNYWFGMALALVLGLGRGDAQQDYGVTVTTGIDGIYPSMESNIYGNDVTQLAAFLPHGAQKCWLDPEKPLPAGKLKAFYFYVHNSSEEEGMRALLLQIWRPTSEMNRYQLVWQKSINFTLPGIDGGLVTVRLEDGEEFETKASDFIGWKFLSEIGFISFGYAPEHKTLYTKATQQQALVPEVSQIYEFDDIYLPSVWAVAVKVDPNCGDTDTTGIDGIYPSIVSNIYGNDVTQLAAFLPHGAQKCWLDPEKPLPAGKLKAFYFYVHNSNAEQGMRALLLQIWRPTSEMNRYQLVWQKSINFTLPGNDGGLVTVRLEDGEEFETKASDFIGWKFLSEIGFISFGYAPEHKTLYTKATQQEALVPEVSQIYQFDDIYLPSVWAVAVKVDPNYGVTVTTGIDGIYPSMESNIYGNDVTQLAASLPHGAQKCWLDPEKPLPAGKLKAFYFYVHNSSEEEGMRALLLQIWRPTSEMNRYQLVWQKSINFTLPGNDGGLVTVRLEDGEEFETKASDFIGWKFLTEIGFISFDFGEWHKTLYTKATQQQALVPEVSQIYEFDDIYLPSVWAVAVKVDRNCGDTVTRDYAVTVTRGINGIYPSAQSNIYGNDVTQLAAFLPHGAQKCWLDPEKPLPAGKLKAFYFYVHNSNVEQGMRALLLQIWRPTSVINRYQLVWQKSISFSLPGNDGGLVTVRLEDGEEFETKASDFIGWKFLSEIGFISFGYAPEHKTLYTKATQQEALVPEVSQTYEFDDVYLPSVWAVAVKVDPTTTLTATSTPTPEVTTTVPTITSGSPSATTTTTTTHTDSSMTTTTTTEMIIDYSKSINDDQVYLTENILESVSFVILSICAAVFAIGMIVACIRSRRRMRSKKGDGEVFFSDTKKPI